MDASKASLPGEVFLKGGIDGGAWVRKTFIRGA
jgi:hypothetical protein